MHGAEAWTLKDKDISKITSGYLRNVHGKTRRNRWRSKSTRDDLGFSKMVWLSAMEICKGDWSFEAS